MDRPSTPPRAPGPSKAAASPPTPEVTRRIEENRLRAKALREQHEAKERAAGLSPVSRTPSGFIATSDVHIPATRKRTHEAYSRDAPTNNRDGRANGAGPAGPKAAEKDGEIRPARKFTKFVDYDFGKMTDTKGGFLTTEDDPFNNSMSGPAVGPDGKPVQDEKPKGMTSSEWERLQLLKKLQRQKAGPYEPGLSVLKDKEERKVCRECGSWEIDFVWEEVFACSICNSCKEKHPDKYSLLTKTECREDYLLTDPELRDEKLLPHLNKPNPHKSHWHDMMLFLRFQVEEYAFSPQKWGSSEALDEEFERRETEKKQRKEAKFKAKLLDLKKRTRTDAYRRQQGKLGGGEGDGKAKFGDKIATGGKHVHEWGRVVENEDGMTVKTCTTCGMEVEELEF